MSVVQNSQLHQVNDKSDNTVYISDGREVAPNMVLPNGGGKRLLHEPSWQLCGLRIQENTRTR